MQLPIDEFVGYFVNIAAQDLAPGSPAWTEKVKTVLERFADTSVRVATSSLLSTDVDIKAMSNDGLAEEMHRHVYSRGGSMLTNSAWAMMLEAAERLRTK